MEPVGVDVGWGIDVAEIGKKCVDATLREVEVGEGAEDECLSKPSLGCSWDLSI